MDPVNSRGHSPTLAPGVLTPEPGVLNFRTNSRGYSLSTIYDLLVDNSRAGEANSRFALRKTYLHTDFKIALPDSLLDEMGRGLWRWNRIEL